MIYILNYVHIYIFVGANIDLPIDTQKGVLIAEETRRKNGQLFMFVLKYNKRSDSSCFMFSNNLIYKTKNINESMNLNLSNLVLFIVLLCICKN